MPFVNGAWCLKLKAVKCQQLDAQRLCLIRRIIDYKNDFKNPFCRANKISVLGFYKIIPMCIVVVYVCPTRNGWWISNGCKEDVGTPKLAADRRTKSLRYAHVPSCPEICCPVLLLRANLNKSSAPAPYLYNHSYPLALLL